MFLSASGGMGGEYLPIVCVRIVCKGFLENKFSGVNQDIQKIDCSVHLMTMLVQVDVLPSEVFIF